MCGFRQSHRLFTSTQCASMVLPPLDTLGKQIVSRAGKQSSASLLLYTSKLPANENVSHYTRISMHSEQPMFKVMYLLKSKSLPPQMFFSSIENLESQHLRHSPAFSPNG